MNYTFFRHWLITVGSQLGLFRNWVCSHGLLLHIGEISSEVLQLSRTIA